MDNTIENNQIYEGHTSKGLDWKLIKGDALKSLATLEDESIDCIITSPPYYSLRDYGIEGQIGLEDAVNDYVQSISDVMDEAKRVLKKDGLLFLNIGDTYYSGKGKSHGVDQKSSKRRFGLRPVDKSGGLGIGLQRKSIIGVPWRVAIEMMKRQWVLRAPIIWHRDKGLPEFVRDRPRKTYEYVFMFAKDRFYYFNSDGLEENNLDQDIWNITARPKANNGLKTAPFPDELVEKCLSVGCPEAGIVLDPFAGSGTTMRVALKEGRSAIGIELSDDFCNYIQSELEGM